MLQWSASSAEDLNQTHHKKLKMPHRLSDDSAPLYCSRTNRSESLVHIHNIHIADVNCVQDSIIFIYKCKPTWLV